MKVKGLLFFAILIVMGIFNAPAKATLYTYDLQFNNPGFINTDLLSSGSATGGTGVLVLNIIGDPLNVNNVSSPHSFTAGESFVATIDGTTFSFLGLTGFNISGGQPGNISGDSSTVSATFGSAFLDLGGNFYQVNKPDNGPYFNGTFSITSVTAAVPEPSTWAMILLGFAGVSFGYRRSHRFKEASAS